jgi:peptidoglycan endopeptidase LytF
MRGDLIVMIQDRQQAPFPTAPAAPRDYVCTEMYTIQAGDTLYSISQRYNVPVSLLMQVNNISNPYCLKIGQRICIPRIGAAQNDNSCSGFFHTIAPGDTPYLLAKRYGVSLESILEVNPSMNPYNLMIGAQICIPGTRPESAPMTPFPPTPAPVPQAPAPMSIPTPPPMPAPTPTPVPAPSHTIPSPSSIQPGSEEPECQGTLYTVMEGDTLYMIAKKHEISLNALMEANPSLDPYNLEIGMKLCIPQRSESSSPAPSAAHEGNHEREDFYYVRIGDNMDKICSRFRVLPRNLIKANPNLTVMDYSTPGTKVCIPSR